MDKKNKGMAVDALVDRLNYIERNASDMRQKIKMRKTALSMVPQVLYILDVEGYIRFISSGFGGVSPETLFGKHFTSVLPDEVLVKLQRAMLEAQARPNTAIHWSAEMPTAQGLARFCDIIVFSGGVFINSGMLDSLT